MSYPKGVPDGAFVRFDGWDVPGNDVGQYFTNMDSRARLAALKGAAVEYGARFFAFNTNGWAKCWATIDPKMFVQAKGCSLYIRVEYPGWVFHPQKDSPGNDIGNVKVQSPHSVIEEINKRQNPYEVKGFNTNGWIKRKVAYPLKDECNLGAFQGLYIREAVAPK